jgi:branched-chain amino acid transport system permease protein
MAAFTQYVLIGLLTGSIYALIALGIVLIYKATAVFNFAVGAMLMVGGMVFWVFSGYLGLNIGISLVLAGICGYGMGFLIERLCLRPLLGQPIIASIMVTLALVSLLQGFNGLVWENVNYGLSEFLPGGALTIGPTHCASELMWGSVICLCLFGLFVLFYQRSKMGLQMRAAAENPQLARSKGLSVNHVFSVTWGIAGLICIVTSILLGLRIGVGNYMAEYGLKAFPVVLLGGIESIPGALVAGLAIGIIEQLVGGYINPCWMEATPYAIVVLVMFFKPYGLFGLKRIERI